MKVETPGMRLSRPESGRAAFSMAALLLAATCIPAAFAQESADTEVIDADKVQGQKANETEVDSARVLESVTVSATKRSGTDIQDVSVAVSALGKEQLDAFNFRDLQSLSYDFPNVQLEEVGTSRGYANYSIRGLGINSSIPSIDPTVGVFVDGVYMGVGAGVNLDNFDIESIEILRGPQSVLFGRNVTGGAVLIGTTAPTDELSVDGSMAYESGDNFYATAVLRGPIAGDSGFSGKLALFYNNDGGYFENKFDGSNQGKAETFIVRPALRWAGDTADVILRLEYGESKGDGAAAQNHPNGIGPGGLFDRDTFDLSIDNRGFYDYSWSSANLTASKDVEFGDGKLTVILGYREVDTIAESDLDATPANLFNSGSSLEQNQSSAEVIYAGTFGNVDLTTGVFYFDQSLDYVEERRVLGDAVVTRGGGYQDTNQWAVYSMADIHLNPQWTFTVGANYGREEKAVIIQTIGSIASTGSICTLGSKCTGGNFVSSDSWDAFSPRIALSYKPDKDTNLYASWTRGFRSGGYNLRNTSPLVSPGPFDQEQVDAYELGAKQEFHDGRVRINAAVFQNKIQDLQREVVIADPVSGFIQVLDNTADATVNGVEAEFRFAPSDNWVIGAQVGYLDGQYDDIKFDLNSPADGVVDERDYALKLPRMAPWTYGFSIVNRTKFTGVGELTSTLRFNHRDKNYALDSNVGYYDPADILNANLTLILEDGRTSLSVYGDNLLDEVTFGFDANLPNMIGPVPLGGTFSPLNKGRVLGLELRYRY